MYPCCVALGKQILLAGASVPPDLPAMPTLAAPHRKVVAEVMRLQQLGLPIPEALLPKSMKEPKEDKKGGKDGKDGKKGKK
jgi:hypothetical protein